MDGSNINNETAKNIVNDVTGGALPAPLNESGQDRFFENGLAIAFFFAGTVALFFIVYGGFQYVTSNGDPQKIESAKNTILYSVIGLIIAMTAFIIVNFVIGNTLSL